MTFMSCVAILGVVGLELSVELLSKLPLCPTLEVYGDACCVDLQPSNGLIFG